MRRSSWPTGNAFGVPVVLGVSLLIVVSSVSAQTPSASEARAFFDTVDVNLVNIDVHVTDADGRMVTNLTLADFELLEDGRPVQITHFASALPPGFYSTTTDNQVGPPAPNEKERTLVLFFDEHAVAPGQRRSNLEQIREFLTRELPPSLRLMLVTFEGGTTLRTPLTDDPSRLVAALDEMARDTRPRRDTERERILRDMLRTAGAMGSTGAHQNLSVGSLNSQSGASGAGSSQKTAAQMKLEELADEAGRYVPEIRAHSASQRRRAEHLLGDLGALVRSLAGVPGRKAILVVGGGLEGRTGEGLFMTWEQAFPEVARQMGVSAAEEARRHDLGPAIRNLAGSANSHRVTLYSLSAPAGGTSVVSAEGIGISGDSFVARSMSGHSAMAEISEATGGRPLLSSSGLADQLGAVVRALGSGYSLGYSPSHPADGRIHALTVRVGRRGINVNHPDSYLSQPETERLSDRTLAAAMLAVTDDPLGLSVEVQEVGPPRPDGSYLVPVLVKVPTGRLMLQPEGDRHIGRVTALVVIQNVDGISEPQSWRYPIEVANDQLMAAVGGQVGMALNLVMGKGPHRIAVGVRDDVAGLEATVTVDVEVPPEPNKEVRDDAI